MCEVFEGCKHGWTVRGSQVYNQADAERAWSVLTAKPEGRSIFGNTVSGKTALDAVFLKEGHKRRCAMARAYTENALTRLHHSTPASGHSSVLVRMPGSRLGGTNRPRQ
jgi:hypothetical protein